MYNHKLTELEKQTIAAAEEYIKTIGTNSGMGYKETVNRMILEIKHGNISDEGLRHLLSIYTKK